MTPSVLARQLQRCECQMVLTRCCCSAVWADLCVGSRVLVEPREVVKRTAVLFIDLLHLVDMFSYGLHPL